MRVRRLFSRGAQFQLCCVLRVHARGLVDEYFCSLESQSCEIHFHSQLKLDEEQNDFYNKKKCRKKYQLTCGCYILEYFKGLVQDCSNSIANALELLQSCAKPLISPWSYRISHVKECGGEFHKIWILRDKIFSLTLVSGVRHDNNQHAHCSRTVAVHIDVGLHIRLLYYQCLNFHYKIIFSPQWKFSHW